MILNKHVPATWHKCSRSDIVNKIWSLWIALSVAWRAKGKFRYQRHLSENCGTRFSIQIQVDEVFFFKFVNWFVNVYNLLNWAPDSCYLFCVVPGCRLWKDCLNKYFNRFLSPLKIQSLCRKVPAHRLIDCRIRFQFKLFEKCDENPFTSGILRFLLVTHYVSRLSSLEDKPCGTSAKNLANGCHTYPLVLASKDELKPPPHLFQVPDGEVSQPKKEGPWVICVSHLIQKWCIRQQAS